MGNFVRSLFGNKTDSRYGEEYVEEEYYNDDEYDEYDDGQGEIPHISDGYRIRDARAAASSAPQETTRINRSGIDADFGLSSLQIITSAPENFDDAYEICDSLKENKVVLVNMESLDAQIAQRILDFISGAVYTRSGGIQPIGKKSRIYVVAPPNVELTDQDRERLKSSGILSSFSTVFGRDDNKPRRF